MNYPEAHIKKLLSGMMPFLDKPSFRTEKVYKTGGELIALGIFTDINGKYISRQGGDAAGKYTAYQNVQVDINHEKKIREIIKKAKNPDKMTDLLGAYVAKHGFPPETKKIVEQITKAK